MLYIAYLFVDRLLEQFLDGKGRLFTPSTGMEWERPISVELRPGASRVADGYRPGNVLTFRVLNFGSELHIQNSPLESFKPITPSRAVRPTPDLLERFIDLAEEDDVRIHKFAKEYGGLEIFFDWGSERVHVEYCDVWRYFAGVIKAVLKISASLSARQSVRGAEWKMIGRLPAAIRPGEHSPELSYRVRKRISATEEWCAIALYLSSSRRPLLQETRSMLIRVLNTLLGLGMVRPWIIWPEVPQAIRPQLVYSGRSLISALALQLCLRVAMISSFVICCHCQQSYLPKKRAPKAGQRNFCPECRDNGVPQQYASISFRQRKRDKEDRRGN
jgi:hypothetical protein